MFAAEKEHQRWVNIRANASDRPSVPLSIPLLAPSEHRKAKLKLHNFILKFFFTFYSCFSPARLFAHAKISEILSIARPSTGSHPNAHVQRAKIQSNHILQNNFIT